MTDPDNSSCTGTDVKKGMYCSYCIQICRRDIAMFMWKCH